MNTQQLLETLSNCITIDTTSGNLYIYGNLQQGAVKSALLYANADGKIVAAPDGVGVGGGLTEVGLENLTATGVRNNTTYLRGDNTWATINYQPLDADLTAIAGLADSSGLLRKVDSSPSWVIDSAEYMTIEASDLRYIPKSSKRDSLVANNTSLIYSVTAVNNALGDKMDVSGGTFTGNLTINSSEPSLIFNDSSSGGVYRFMVDGGQFYLKYGTTTPVTLITINSTGGITLESTITSTGFKTPTGTSSQFLKANGTVDSTSYQPLDADLTAISALADSSGLLRKVDATPSWVIDTEEYMTILASDNRYVAKSSKRDSLVANNTSLFYSVTAVNNALADKMNIDGGTFTGDLTVESSYASLILNDTSSGGVYRFMSDGGQFYLKYGTSTLTTLLTSNSSGAFTFASSVTATSFIKSGGTAAQFLKADGSVDSSTYITSTALSGYLTTAAAATSYQPLNDNLTAITGFGTDTGILKKINDYGWALDTNTYLTSADLSNYQLTANLSTNLTASASKYPSVNAVNTGLALKLNLSGGTLSGGLTLTYSVPTISLNDNSAGVIWNILNDGSTFKLNNGATNKFYIFNNGNAEFANNLTAAAFVKSGGTSSQFLKADGSVDSSSYLTTSSADSGYLKGTSNPGTPGNFTLSIGNNGTYSYVQSHSGQPLELNPVGNTVRIAGNIAIHAGNYNLYTDPRYVRKDTTGQYLKPFYEYGSYIGNDAPSTLTTQMGGGGLRVDFQNPGPTGSWSHILTWSGYNRYSMNQIATDYYTSSPRIWYRQTDYHNDSWTSWRQFVLSDGGTYNLNISGNAVSANNVPWTGITEGKRTNYTLGFEPPVEGWAGFKFTSTTGDNAGYLLIRGTSDNDVYTAEGITLVADRGWLTLAQRTTASKGIRFMTGISGPPVRFQIDTNGFSKFNITAGGAGSSDRVTIRDDSSGTNIDLVSYVAGGQPYSSSSGVFVNGGKDMLLMVSNANMKFVTGGYTEQMRLWNNGNLALGNPGTDTGYKLQVGGSAYFTGNVLASGNLILDVGATRYIQIGSATNYYWRLRSLNDDFEIRMADTFAALKMYYPNGAATFINTVTATAFYESSDSRLKDLLEDDVQVKNIENLKAKLYIKNDKKEYGYFAQEAQSYMPSAVTTNEDGYLNLSYREVHTAKIARLEQRIAELEKQLNLN